MRASLGSQHSTLDQQSLGRRHAGPHSVWGVPGRPVHRQHSSPATQPGTVEQQTSTAPPEEAHRMVDQVLTAVEGTDGGINISEDKRREVDGLLEQLQLIGSRQQPRPLSNPLLFGNFNVAYTSAGRSQSGQPAGGRFRGKIGRTLFQTTGIFQSVLQPDIATNKVSFKLFGLITGAVGLRGKVEPIATEQGPSGDTVRVAFEPPVLSLGTSTSSKGGLHLRIGPPSSVVLTTTYLDERVRLGKGSRGSLFVFTRGGAADEADMANVGLQRTARRGSGVLGAFLAGLAFGAAALWRASPTPAARGAAVGVAVLALLLGLVLWRGGIIRDDEPRVASSQVDSSSSSSSRDSTTAAS